jgi:uncharacterized protein YneF (UPF0154 family)
MLSRKMKKLLERQMSKRPRLTERSKRMMLKLMTRMRARARKLKN